MWIPVAIFSGSKKNIYFEIYKASQNHGNPHVFCSSTHFPPLFPRSLPGVAPRSLKHNAGTAGTAVAFPTAKGEDTAEARQAAKVSHEKREKQAAKVRLMEVGSVGSAVLARVIPVIRCYKY